MTVKELHSELIEAYSLNNLNTISLTLINLFKNRQFSVLQKISEMISDVTEVKIGNDGKGFSRLMMLYHPDRAVYHITEINRLAAENNLEGLMKYAHILKLERIGELASTIESYDSADIDYSPVYDWDMSDIEEEGFRIFDVNEREDKLTDFKKNGCSFYDALKIREFGDPDANYPLYYLEEMEDFEMSSYGINDLDGIQLCTHARTIDLSNNKITDLQPLIELEDIEELNLSDNHIGFIDELSNLKRLKSILLSNNYIKDISPLFGLDSLEYVDITGNEVDSKQINHLAGMGVTVDY